MLEFVKSNEMLRLIRNIEAEKLLTGFFGIISDGEPNELITLMLDEENNEKKLGVFFSNGTIIIDDEKNVEICKKLLDEFDLSFTMYFILPNLFNYE